MSHEVAQMALGDEWTIEALDALPEDGRRRELLDGMLLVHPSPTSIHQIIAMRLMVALEQTCPVDYQVTQAVEVRLSARRSFIPDVLAVTDQAAQRRAAHYTADEVVLAVEIVAATSESLDRVLKPALYAQAGIPHFWRVETEDGIVVHTFERDSTNATYVPSGSFADVVTLDKPWRIDLPLAGLRPRHF